MKVEIMSQLMGRMGLEDLKALGPIFLAENLRRHARMEWQNPPHVAFDWIEGLTRYACEQFEAGRLDVSEPSWSLVWEAYSPLLPKK